MRPARRVRTGCITCRSRRVKCDEGRPMCYNCTRLNRACLYQPPVLNNFNTASPSLTTPISWNELQSMQCNEVVPNTIASNNMQDSFAPLHDMVDEVLTGSAPSDLGHTEPEMSLDLDLVTGEWGDLFTLGSSTLLPGPGSSPNEPSPSSHAVLVDVANTEISTHTNFAYFLESVEPPFITPWDSKNWKIAKAHIVQLATASPTLVAAIAAVESLYASLVNGSDISSALSQYFSAKSLYLSLIADKACDLELAIIVTFVHCCFEVATQQETVSATLKRTSSLITRLKERPISQHCSPIIRRVCTWLCLLHTKAMHLGGRGILSPQLLSTLQHQYQHQQQQPFLCLDSADSAPSSLSSIAADSLHHCMFQFYCELQWISATVSDLNRHHRPRGSTEDETEVASMAQDIRQNLTYLWEGRPRILDASSTEIAQNLPSFMSPDVLAKLIQLSQLCRISYNAELIYHARGSSEFDSLSPTVVNARHHIRNEVDEMLASHTTEQCVSPALIWPLFQYAVESTDEVDILWAVQRLKMVKNHLWSSESVVAFIEALSAEQLRKGDRVDSRFFCIQKFGTIPPFI